ncbi:MULTISPECIES: hypothetical protein [Sphingomonas]
MLRFVTMTESVSTKAAAVTMRNRAAQRRALGQRRDCFWLSAETIEFLNEVQEALGLSSREAAINAVLSAVRENQHIRQEFLAVTT